MKYLIISIIVFFGLTESNNNNKHKFETSAICIEMPKLNASFSCAQTFCPNDRQWVCEDYGNGEACEPTACTSPNCNP
jgi:hypothetical protein